MHVAALLAVSLFASPAAKPNIILVTVDTLRGDVLGYAGGPAATPNLDALAKESWTFQRCIAASMLTNPSHASIMTSLYPRDHGVYDNDSGIADGVPTLATALQEHGWHTVAVLNFRHLNPQVSNLGQGFDELVHAKRSERRAAQTTTQALQLLDGMHQPFFMWLHYTDPHAPYDAGAPHKGSAPKFRKTSMREVKKAAPSFQKNNPWFQKAFSRYGHSHELVRRYLAEVEAVDTALGRLMQGLEERGLNDDTMVVITADHGENLGDHALYFHHGGLYDSTVHVPLIMHVPNEQAGLRGGLVASVDIAPTILDLVGVPHWKPIRGRSLVPYARGHGEPRQFAFSEHMLGQLASVRSMEGTLIVHQRDSRQFPSYPMRRGQREIYPVTISEVGSSRLDRALRRFLTTPGGLYQPRAAPPSNREALRSLGYTD